MYYITRSGFDGTGFPFSTLSTFIYFPYFSRYHHIGPWPRGRDGIPASFYMERQSGYWVFFTTTAAAARLGLDRLSWVEMNRRSGLDWTGVVWIGGGRTGLLTSNLLARLRGAFV